MRNFFAAIITGFVYSGLLASIVWGVRTLYRRIRKWIRRNVIENTHFQVVGESYARIDTEEKVVALTFDDGPYPPFTDELLALLRELHVQATFFIIGEHIERYRTSAMKVVSEGHQVGNHTYSHPQMLSLSLKRMRNEIRDTDALIRSVGYLPPTVFRAPFGLKFLKLPLLLWALGKKHVLFDFFPLPRDWDGATPDAVVGSILENVRPGSIIVLHDGNAVAAPLVCDYTKLLVHKLRGLGYSFVTVDELIQKSKQAA